MKKENRAGLYLTVIFHLTVIIVLLLYSIDSTLRREESFVLDFSKQEEIERKEKEEVMKQDISRKLEEMIAAARQQPSNQIRNIAVDAGAQLKDDRGTDAPMRTNYTKTRKDSPESLKTAKKTVLRKMHATRLWKCSIRTSRTTASRRRTAAHLLFHTISKEERQAISRFLHTDAMAPEM